MLLRNSLWNLAGSALPALVALGTVPLMIHGLGIEGFGIVTLITSVIGYFGIFDVNLSAGSIKYLSEHHARQQTRRFAETFWFGIAFYALLGLIAGVLLFTFASSLLDRFFNVSAELHDDALHGLQIAALGYGLLQLQNYLLVVPQALQRYDRSARGEAFFGIAVNLISAAVAVQGGGIAGVLASRVAVSVVNLLWLAGLIRQLGAQLGLPLSPVLPGRGVCIALAQFSGHSWLSRVASMLHQHADKLIVGSLAGPIALAMYTVPSQLASRILGLTYRLSSVIYPRVSALAATGELRQLQALYLDATRLLTYLNVAVLGMIAITGELFLAKWVGTEFVEEGYPVLLLITAGLLIDSLTIIPSLVNDGLGHPKITGRFAIARGLLGIAMVWTGTNLGGIIGAAAAHLLSSLLMTALFLAYVHGRTIPTSLSETLRACWGPSFATGISVLLLILPLKWALPQTMSGLLLLAGASGVALVGAGLSFVMRVEERAALLSATRRHMPGMLQ
jgi:O-antigen/teichoic acid export membrane protein